VGAGLSDPVPRPCGAQCRPHQERRHHVGFCPKANFNDDRLRLNAAAGLGDLHLAFYGVGADAGSRDISVANEQDMDFANGRILTRIAKDMRARAQPRRQPAPQVARTRTDIKARLPRRD